MASFYVLTPPGSTDPEKDTVFVRDGFSWLGFVLPLPWLLARKLWLLAGLVFVAYLAVALVADLTDIAALPMAFGLVVSLWVGLEGGHVRADWLQKKGWTLRAAMTAHDLDEAEEIYFAGEITAVPVASPSMPVGRAGRTSDAVALGLIAPYGSR
jgi:hypothetical protein